VGFEPTSDFRRCRFSRPRHHVSSCIDRAQNSMRCKGFPAQTYHPVSLRIGPHSLDPLTLLLTLADVSPAQSLGAAARRAPLLTTAGQQACGPAGDPKRNSGRRGGKSGACWPRLSGAAFESSLIDPLMLLGIARRWTRQRASIGVKAIRAFPFGDEGGEG
jgi:hypothetical protein